jgi:hypothetical protein
LALLGIVYAGSGLAGGAPKPPLEDVAKALQAVLEDNVKALNEKALDLGMSAIHSQSPVLAPTRQMLEKIHAAYDLHVEILSFAYIGRDAEYAVARASQKTTKVRGPEFRDNVVDAMHIFRQENGQWKVWQSAVLSVEFLTPPEAETQPATRPAGDF